VGLIPSINYILSYRKTEQERRNIFLLMLRLDLFEDTL